MDIRLTRRRMLLATSAAFAQFSLSGSSLASLLKGGSVPTVDTLSVKVLTDSSYDTPRPGTNKHVKVKRTAFISAADYRKAIHNEWGLALALESRIDQAVGDRLAAVGHDIEWWPEWTWKAGAMCLIDSDRTAGVHRGGADPRRASYALGW